MDWAEARVNRLISRDCQSRHLSLIIRHLSHSPAHLRPQCPRRPQATGSTPSTKSRCPDEKLAQARQSQMPNRRSRAPVPGGKTQRKGKEKRDLPPAPPIERKAKGKESNTPNATTPGAHACVCEGARRKYFRNLAELNGLFAPSREPPKRDTEIFLANCHGSQCLCGSDE